MSYNPIEGHLSLKVSECDTPFYDKDYEVLIKVEATAVNRADLLQTQGKYPPPRGASKIVGLECVGYLVDPKTDEITDRKFMCLLPGGGYAQYAIVHKDHIMQVPDNMEFEEAAAIPEQWTTAY